MTMMTMNNCTHARHVPTVSRLQSWTEAGVTLLRVKWSPLHQRYCRYHHSN